MDDNYIDQINRMRLAIDGLMIRFNRLYNDLKYECTLVDAGSVEYALISKKIYACNEIKRDLAHASEVIFLRLLHEGDDDE